MYSTVAAIFHAQARELISVRLCNEGLVGQRRDWPESPCGLRTVARSFRPPLVCSSLLGRLMHGRAQTLDVDSHKPDTVPQAHPGPQRCINVCGTLRGAKNLRRRCAHCLLANLPAHVLRQLAKIGVVDGSLLAKGRIMGTGWNCDVDIPWE